MITFNQLQLFQRKEICLTNQRYTSLIGGDFVTWPDNGQWLADIVALEPVMIIINYCKLPSIMSIPRSYFIFKQNNFPKFLDRQSSRVSEFVLLEAHTFYNISFSFKKNKKNCLTEIFQKRHLDFKTNWNNLRQIKNPLKWNEKLCE